MIRKALQGLTVIFKAVNTKANKNPLDSDVMRQAADTK
jgi:hypothetical protein